MNIAEGLDRAALEEAIRAAVHEQVLEAAEPGARLPEVGVETRLFGQGGLLDSLGLVNTVLEVEQWVQETYDVTITIADDRAMSQARSPFRTVGSLADYVAVLIQEQG